MKYVRNSKNVGKKPPNQDFSLSFCGFIRTRTEEALEIIVTNEIAEED